MTTPIPEWLLGRYVCYWPDTMHIMPHGKQPRNANGLIDDKWEVIPDQVRPDVVRASLLVGVESEFGLTSKVYVYSDGEITVEIPGLELSWGWERRGWFYGNDT